MNFRLEHFNHLLLISLLICSGPTNLAYFMSKAAPQDALWRLVAGIFDSQSTAASGGTGSTSDTDSGGIKTIINSL